MGEIKVAIINPLNGICLLLNPKAATVPIPAPEDKNPLTPAPTPLFAASVPTVLATSVPAVLATSVPAVFAISVPAVFAASVPNVVPAEVIPGVTACGSAYAIKELNMHVDPPDVPLILCAAPF